MSIRRFQICKIPKPQIHVGTLKTVPIQLLYQLLQKKNIFFRLLILVYSQIVEGKHGETLLGYLDAAFLVAYAVGMFFRYSIIISLPIDTVQFKIDLKNLMINDQLAAICKTQML